MKTKIEITKGEKEELIEMLEMAEGILWNIQDITPDMIDIPDDVWEALDKDLNGDLLNLFNDCNYAWSTSGDSGYAEWAANVLKTLQTLLRVILMVVLMTCLILL